MRGSTQHAHDALKFASATDHPGCHFCISSCPGSKEYVTSTLLSVSDRNDGMKSNSLHLYRALLRETTYLFDPAACRFHRQHIRHAFQCQREKLKLQHGADQLLRSRVESQQLHRARKYLCMLERANQGYMRAVTKVLQLTYGVKGTRRRQLMHTIMAPVDSEVEKTVSASTSMSDHGWRPPAKFEALLKSQARIQRFHAGNFQVKVEIPESNSHAKPFPTCRIKNMTKKWYARQAEMLKPPLQENEHVGIYKKAIGQDKMIRSKPRRPLATVHILNGASGCSGGLRIDLIDVISTSKQATKPQYSNRVRASIGNPHRLTSRYLRRRYQMDILQNSPTVLQGPETGKLAFRWSTGVQHGAVPETLSISQQLSLFGKTE